MRAVRPEPSPAVLPPKSGSRRLRGLPVLVYEVSRRVWGLRLRRTEQELALSSLPILPSVHYKDVGVRIASFRSSMAHPACSPVYASLCTSRYPTQNSGPSGSLFLSRGVSSTPASYRFIPAHCNGDFSPITLSLAREWPPLLAQFKLVFGCLPEPYTLPTHHALFRHRTGNGVWSVAARFAHAEQPPQVRIPLPPAFLW